jgi:hypothetical protein
MTNISIDILESTNEITTRILNALLPQVTTFFDKAFDNCKNDINNIVSEAIIASPEYQSILSGKLRYEFGLPDSDARLSSILSIISNIKTNYNKPKISKSQIQGSFSLYMIPSDYSELLSSAAAIFTTEKGSKLEWLKWLLLLGDKTIIKDYVVEIGPNSRSRTGNAIMVGSVKGRWNVPPEFAGTKNNNWITRAIDSVNDNIEQLLAKSLRI